MPTFQLSDGQFLYGTVPLRASGTAQFAVVAFDGQSMAAADLFTVTFAAASRAFALGEHDVQPAALGRIDPLHT